MALGRKTEEIASRFREAKGRSEDLMIIRRRRRTLFRLRRGLGALRRRREMLEREEIGSFQAPVRIGKS